MSYINLIEKEFPLTIVRMRFGKFAILNCDADADCVLMLQCNEETQYSPHGYMLEYYSTMNYGIGATIQSACMDYYNRKTSKVE